MTIDEETVVAELLKAATPQPPNAIEAQAVVRAARVRSRRRVLASAVIACLLAGGVATLVTTSGHHTSAPATPGHRTVLDGGALVVVPVAGAAPRIDRASAARVLAGVQTVGEGALTPVLARVTVDIKSPEESGAIGLRRLQLPLAWVYLQRQPQDGDYCSGPVGSSTPLPGNASHTWAIIVDATTGVGYVYVGAGAGFCEPETTPIVRRAFYQVSIPFTNVKEGPLLYKQTYQLPPCGQLAMFMPGPKQGIATAVVPTGPCNGRATTRVMVTPGRVSQNPHARLGLICWSTYDARYGKPADCVPLT